MLEPVLAPTYGVIVYQEQVMQIAQVLAAIPSAAPTCCAAPWARRSPKRWRSSAPSSSMGARSRTRRSPRSRAGIFDLMEKFAEYGFNKSHSAAYALVSYQTAWLKDHYPAEFMAAVLSADMHNTDKVVTRAPFATAWAQ
jgi:DNA polymerase-3 subunit alpha